MSKDHTPKGQRFEVSIKDWNKAFAYRGKHPFTKVIVFVNDQGATSCYVPTLLAKIIFCLTFPFLAQAHLITGDWKGFWKDAKKILFPLKYGGFGVDYTYRSSKGWGKLCALIGINEVETRAKK